MTNDLRQKVYRLCSLSEWEASVRNGVITANKDDKRDGFLHLCKEGQVLRSALKHYSHINNLQVLGILVRDIQSILKFEPNRSGELFPHAYGVISYSSVIFARPVPVNNGVYFFPKELFS